MFFDNIDVDRHALLCHDSAHEACDAQRAAGPTDPAAGLAHAAEYWAAHPEHAARDESKG